jgi:hypothetical protein
MKCNNHRFGARKAFEQGWEINKMLNLVNVDDIGFGNSPIDASQKISARIIQSTNDLAAIFSRLFLFITDPRAPENTGSTMSCAGISGVLNNRCVVGIFLPNKHLRIDSVVPQSAMLTVCRARGATKSVMRR